MTQPVQRESTPSKNLPKDPTRTRHVPISGVSVSHIRQMYDLYSRYYENTALDVFLSDLSKKSGVLMITRKADERLVGFSTLTLVDMQVDGRRVRGLFSGDTIVEKAYWGNNTLANAFYRRLLVERLRQPFVPFYWLLISKGYKTYLLLTNNFYNYYPSVKGNDERYRKVTQAYCQQLFPEAFQPEKMLLDFGERYACLKGDVAEITPEIAAANAHIAFFETVNPTWRRGTEMPCLGSIDWPSIVRSLVDVPLKWLRKHVLGVHPRPSGATPVPQAHAARHTEDDASADLLDTRKAS